MAEVGDTGLGDGGELLDLARRIAGWAGPGEQVEAYVTRGDSTNVRVYDADVESFSAAMSEGVAIRVIASGRQGFAFAGSLDGGVVAEAFAEARDNAGFGTEDPCAGVASPDGVAAAPLHLFDYEMASVSADDKIALALDLERRIREGDPRIKSVPQAGYGDSVAEGAVATSTGIESVSRRTRCSVSAYALSGDDTQTETGWAAGVAQSIAQLDVDRVVAQTVERATRMLGATKPGTASLPVVLSPEVAAEFLAVVSMTLSGEAVVKGRSLFADRVGEPVAAAMVSLVEDPTDAAAYGASTYDSEGLACRPVPLVTGGRLDGFLYNTYAARLAGNGASSTASAVRAMGIKGPPGVGARALRVLPGPMTEDEVIAAAGDGVYVQAVSGLHSGVNPVSGDFSVGASGLMIRGGTLAEPVREFTIASTIQRMLLGVVAIGDTLEHVPSAAAGVALAIDGMQISGT